jgi:hypothetical protein
LATSRRVQIEKFVKKVRESTLTLVKDAFYTTTDFEDPCPVKMVLEAYGKMGEKTSVGYKQTVKDLEELPIIPLPPSPAPTSSPAASTLYPTGPTAYTLELSPVHCCCPNVVPCRFYL